jgi:hypothetical protein
MDVGGEIENVGIAGPRNLVDDLAGGGADAIVDLVGGLMQGGHDRRIRELEPLAAHLGDELDRPRRRGRLRDVGRVDRRRG